MPRTPEIFVQRHSKYSLGILKIGRTHFANFVYVIIDNFSKDAVLIDPGFEHELILSQLDAWNANLRAILLTHSHLDHTNQVEILREILNVPVYISSLERLTESIARCKPLDFGHLTVLRLGTLKILCIHTPGHSPGSFCFQIENFLFTGDTLFNEGCGYCTPPFGSAKDMFNSLGILKEMVGADVYIFPAHQFKTKPGLTMGQICRLNPYLMMHDAETFAVFSQRRPIIVHPMDE